MGITIPILPMWNIDKLRNALINFDFKNNVIVSHVSGQESKVIVTGHTMTTEAQKTFWASVVMVWPVTMTLDSWPETWETMTLFLKSKLMRALRSLSMFHIGRIGMVMWPFMATFLTWVCGTWDSRRMFHSWLMVLVESSFLEPRAAVRVKEKVLGLEDLRMKLVVRVKPVTEASETLEDSSSDMTIFKLFWRRSWTWDSMPWETTFSGLKALMIFMMVGLVLTSLISSWERPEIGDFFRVWYWMPVWPSTLVAAPILISKPRALVEVLAGSKRVVILW